MDKILRKCIRHRGKNSEENEEYINTEDHKDEDEDNNSNN